MKVSKIDATPKEDDISIVKVDFMWGGMRFLDFEYKGTEYSRLLLNKRRKDGRWDFGVGPGYVLITDWRENERSRCGMDTKTEYKFHVNEKDETKAALAALLEVESLAKDAIEVHKSQGRSGPPKFMIKMSTQNLHLISEMAKSAKEAG